MALVNLVTTPFAVHNLHGPDKSVANRHGSIVALLNAAKGGLGGFNEFNAKDKSFLLAEAEQRGLNVRIVGLNGIVWNPNVYRVSDLRAKKIMQGGHVGADGTTQGPDNRRVGPSRFCLYFEVLVIAIDLEFELDVTHLMARAFSVHTWRQRLFNKSVNELADGVLLPDGILFGDMNDPHQIDLPGVQDVSVPAPPDMGRQHYTQIHRWGKHIYVSSVKAKNTPSDHHLLSGIVTFYRMAQNKLAPASSLTQPRPSVNKLPKPGASGVNWKHYGAPVAHPWAVKRRPKKLTQRVHKWQAAYRRRL